MLQNWRVENMPMVARRLVEIPELLNRKVAAHTETKTAYFEREF